MLRVEVAAAFTPAHRQGGKGVFEGLLERGKFQYRQIDRGMKTQAALVRTNGHAVLDAIATIDLYLPLVIDPAHAKHHNAFGLYQAIEQPLFGITGIFQDEGSHAFADLGDGLQKLGLARVPIGHMLEKRVNRGGLHRLVKEFFGTGFAFCAQA